MSDFNPKLFKAQLQALLEHHSAGKLAHTPDNILADFLTNCLQSFARAGQDRALFAAVMVPEPDAKALAEESFMDTLLSAKGEEVDPPQPEGDDLVRRGPTLVKAGEVRIFKLPAVADQATMDLLAIEVAAAPSPVMVQFMLDGEVQREWAQGNTIEIGDIKYRVIGILPDGTLILERRVTATPGETGLS